jgi:MFS superfamily sulfate permease-like transporter
LQESAGGVTHLASVTSAGVMLLIIVWIGPIFRTLPRAVLSCIVVVNLRSMFLQFKQLPGLWLTARLDFATWMAAFCGVLVFGVDLGLLFGIFVLLICLVYTNSKPTLVPISSYKDSEFYFNRKRSDDDSQEEIEFYEFTGPLNFVSAPNFGLGSAKNVRIIDCSKVTSIDSVGLAKFIEQVKGKSVKIVNLSPTIRGRLELTEGFDQSGLSFHPTLLDARQHLV